VGLKADLDAVVKIKLPALPGTRTTIIQPVGQRDIIDLSRLVRK
jgi:hypothetical protein